MLREEKGSEAKLADFIMGGAAPRKRAFRDFLKKAHNAENFYFLEASYRFFNSLKENNRYLQKCDIDTFPLDQSIELTPAQTEKLEEIARTYIEENGEYAINNEQGEERAYWLQALDKKNSAKDRVCCLLRGIVPFIIGLTQGCQDFFPAFKISSAYREALDKKTDNVQQEKRRFLGARKSDKEKIKEIQEKLADVTAIEEISRDQLEALFDRYEDSYGKSKLPLDQKRMALLPLPGVFNKEEGPFRDLVNLLIGNVEISKKVREDFGVFHQAILGKFPQLATSLKLEKTKTSSCYFVCG